MVSTIKSRLKVTGAYKNKSVYMFSKSPFSIELNFIQSILQMLPICKVQFLMCSNITLFQTSFAHLVVRRYFNRVVEESSHGNWWKRFIKSCLNSLSSMEERR